MLCFCAGGSFENSLTEALRKGGWELYTAESAEQAESLGAQLGIPVGLLFLEGEMSEAAIQATYAVVNSCADTLWLALLSDRQRMSDEVCNLVATCCNDFFTPPYDIRRMVETIGHSAGLSRIRHRSFTYRGRPSTFHGMVGQSQPMRRLYRLLSKVARSDAPVLLRGETGSGKEMAAHAIHRMSERAAGPFVAVNCAALTPAQLQSELFGDRRKPSTDTDRTAASLIEAAQGGVLFLDEVGYLPAEQQARLLRLLDDNDAEFVGDRLHGAPDLRIIASTHEDLLAAISEGRFREDLYYHLCVLKVDIPALRERGDDVELLAHYLLFRHREDSEFQLVRGFDWQALAAMHSYPWPGNVRELLSRVRSALVRTDHNLLSVQDLGLARPGASPANAATLEFSRAESDRRCIEHALAHNANNMSRAARDLGVSRTTLYRLMDKLDIAPRKLSH
ncbi:sigma 54-interacting transcriptional regulator [Haliea sp. E17]|uniref:sigma 54-interacting transcriptional regulator n=1 Tax=Haliea sp. E17 TaxID=3401576 RepID=UPI003AB0CF4F